MTLCPNDFPCIEYYLYKFKTLKVLCIKCQLDLSEDRCIYVILSKLSSAYFSFVYTFYATREALGSAYKKPSLECFCDAMIQEQDKLLQLGLISIVGTSNKALVVQQKDKSKNQHPRHNNKQNNGPKASHPAFAPNGDKG
jgi:hypothetical protein